MTTEIICLSCLSTDRSLFSIKELLNTLKSLNIINRNVHQSFGICWECKAVIMKFWKFKKQVALAQNLLSHNNQNVLSTLTTSLKVSYDYIYTFEESLENVKVESEGIKQEEIDRNTELNVDDDDNQSDLESKNISENLSITIKREVSIKDKDEIDYEIEICKEETNKQINNLKTQKNYVCKEKRDVLDNNEAKSITQSKSNIDESLIRITESSNVGKQITTQYQTVVFTLEEMKKKRSVHCSLCDGTFETKQELDEHKRTTHPSICNDCGKKFKGSETLRKHRRRVHNSKRQFICDTCRNTFADKTRLEFHMATHCKALAVKLAYCDRCCVQYKSLANYKNHLKISANHTEKRHECKDCKKKFVTRAYLVKHRNFYHLKKTDSKCEICNKMFISDYLLKTHNQIHHGMTRPRNHECNICGNKFFTNAALRSHRMIHSAERRFMCEDCGDTFKQKASFYTHCRLVHKGIKRTK